MRMIAHFPGPSVQDGGETDQGAQMPGVFAQSQEGVSGGAKKQAVTDLGIGRGQRSE